MIDNQLGLPLALPDEMRIALRNAVLRILERRRRPAAAELVIGIEESLGVKARWDLMSVIDELSKKSSLPLIEREYLHSLIASNDLNSALRGDARPTPEVASTIDDLVQRSVVYRSSKQFQEMIEFMAKFRAYAAYNNMLVRIQNPSCSFYATAKDWHIRFNRKLREDAKPMLILAPMHPVMLVYDLDNTTGPSVPDELLTFAKFEGMWDPAWLARTCRNAAEHDGIRVESKSLSSTNAGFAAVSRGDARWKMRIALHEGLDDSSRFGVLCHELAHIHLGHLGSDSDNWWPSRIGLNHNTIEIEAETVAYIVTQQLGLTGSSIPYVSRHPASLAIVLCMAIMKLSVMFDEGAVAGPFFIPEVLQRPPPRRARRSWPPNRLRPPHHSRRCAAACRSDRGSAQRALEILLYWTFPACDRGTTGQRLAP
jgi:hypothetical protein